MLIHGDMLQKLVDKIIEDIGYNINIIDTNGIIIASGSRDRIGKFHKVGLQAAENKCRIDIHEADESHYNHVKSGINLPFYYKDNLIGVIGITGKPSQISELTNIVKSMIELMYEQELLKQKMYYRRSNKVFFINEVLNISNRESLTSIKNWGAKLGYDMSVRRTIVIIQFEAKEDRQAFFSTEDMTHDFMINLKKVKNHHKNDISTFLSSSRIVILKASYEGDDALEKQHLKEYVEAINLFVKDKYPMECRIGAGSFYDDLYDLKESFFEAEYLVNRYIGDTDKNSRFIQDHLIGYFASKLQEGVMEHFFDESYKKVKEFPELLDTIVSLVNNNMHLNMCSQDLFVHRNTVLFRMNKIKEILQIDPVNVGEERAFFSLFAEYILFKNNK